MALTEADVICPYFNKEEIKRGCSMLTCKPFAEGLLSTNLYFKNKEEKQAYMRSFCCCHCWKGCSLAIAIYEYEQISKGGGEIK